VDEAAFATWALKRVSQAEFRVQYYELLKLYGEHGKRTTERNESREGSSSNAKETHES